MRTAIFLSALVALLMTPLAAQQTGQAQSTTQTQNGRGRQTQNRDPTQAPAAGTAAVAGRIAASDTGRPLKRALVLVSASGRGGRSTQTDEQGVYQITGLQAGSYTITASKAGFVDAIYGQLRPQQPGTPIDIADGQQVANVDLRLIRGGVIAGHVLDEDGDALARAVVTVQRYQYLRGEKQLSAAGTGQTDDRGQYRIFGLPPGDYYVSAVVTDAMRGMNSGGFGGRGGRGGGFGFGPTDPESNGYAPTYYPGVASAADAGKVSVGPGQELTSIDFQVQLVPFATITGVVAGADSPGQVRLIPLDVGGVMMGGLALGGRAGPGGTFTVNNVPPGRYLMVARTTGRWDDLKVAIQPINVAGQNITGMVLTLMPGVSVSGNITVESSGTPAPTDYSTIRIDVPDVDPLPSIGGPGAGGGGPNQTGGRADKNGAFEVDNLLPGRHYIRVTAQSPWAVKSVTLSGRDISDMPFELKSGENAQNLSIVLTDRVTSLGGTVRDAMSNGVGGLTVIAFAQDEQYWHANSRLIQAARTTQTGAYMMKGLPPGDYLMIAVDDAQQGEWFDPAYLETLRGTAVHVSVNEGDSLTQDLKAPGG